MARVEELMQKDVSVCREDAPMTEAARIMWEHDCGFVPVVAGDGSGRVVGVITDRDVCMAAYTRGRALPELCVADAMSRGVSFCKPGDSAARAAAEMRASRVRRLPVVDSAGQLLGVLSLADLAHPHDSARKRALGASELADVLEAVSTPRERLALPAHAQ